MKVADDRSPWWEKPYRIVQTNLRLTDASLDPDALARQVREFGATTVTFNVGGIFAFYPTELPLQARNPFLTRDLAGDMLAAAHREGLTMVGRYDLSKGTRIAYEAHPDWFVHNKDGEPQEYNGTYQACVNGGWARDYAHRILRESLSRYALDGAFFNMTGYQPVDYSGRHRGICWCRNCQDGFAAMFQRRLPEREDFSDPAYADYLLFKRRTSQAVAQQIYDTVKSLRPKTGVMGNGRAACDFMRLELQRAVSRPAPEWPHQAGELSRWGAAVGRGKAYACASTNFLDYQWRFSSETPAHHMLRFGQQIASGAQVDYYLLGTFDQDNTAPLEPVRKFMHWHGANQEHFVGTKSLARVGLYHSRATDLHAGATATGRQHVNGFRGAYRLLLEARIPFDFVSDERMGDADVAEQLAAYDVIVLPNVACLSAEEAAVLDAFVAQGGTLIATGETGLYDERGQRGDAFALESFPASRLNLAADKLETYVEIGVEELDFPKTRLLHLDGWYFYTDRKDDAERLLKLLPPPKYGPPELCFPELEPDDHAGVLTRRFGKGQAIYLPWLPEWLYFRDGLPEHRELLAQLIGRASQPAVKLVGAGPLEVTVRAKEHGAGDLVVHLVNYAGQRQSAYEEPPAISGLRLGVKGAGGPARSLVDGSLIEVGSSDAEGYAWLDVPDVKYLQAILIPRAG
ncbi:beta-galactosidase trimerization domain-containing protein [Phenylobacterium sp. LjRoot219]|uniref:beta-galactosidase trimerization domain-containing protein n=1 Tax=Phenylobacterium sp. LjRoot219 TaxID=3342283 RepID=UPI003ECD7097